MARSHARILTSICSDDDFKALPSAAQNIYFWALAQPQMSMCGVVAYTERRWASLSADTTAADVRAALHKLEERRYVMVDDDTDEVFIRSFVANDGGILKTPNLLKAMVSDYAAIMSPRIKRAFLWEWHAKLAERVDPDMERRQWRHAMAALKTLPPAPLDDPWTTPSSKGSDTPLSKTSDTPSESVDNPVDNPRFGKGSAKGSPKGSPKGSTAPARAGTPQPHLTSTTPEANPSARTPARGDTAEHEDAPGRPAPPKPQPPDPLAQAVLERIAGEAPPPIGTALRNGCKPEHTAAVQTALDRGWTPTAVIETVSGWQKVRSPPHALLARLRSLADRDPPPVSRPPPPDPAYHARLNREASSDATAAEQLARIRAEHFPRGDDDR